MELKGLQELLVSLCMAWVEQVFPESGLLDSECTPFIVDGIYNMEGVTN